MKKILSLAIIALASVAMIACCNQPKQNGDQQVCPNKACTECVQPSVCPAVDCASCPKAAECQKAERPCPTECATCPKAAECPKANVCPKECPKAQVSCPKAQASCPKAQACKQAAPCTAK
jgi:hypothetical protein